MIVECAEPVTLVGGSKFAFGTLDECLKIAPVLVAADGGANPLVATGRLPTAVIGDLDSLDDRARAALPADLLFEISEQNSTDFQKSMRYIKAPLVLAVGFTGARIDHELAVFSALLDQGRSPCIVIGEEDIVFAAPTRLSLDLEIGSRLSLFPMSDVSGRSNGLRWPIEGLEFSPSGRSGTSNRVVGKVALDFDRAGMLVILPRSALRAAIAALSNLEY